MTFKLPKVSPEQAKTAAEKARHLLAAATGRCALQQFLVELALSLLLAKPSPSSRGVRVATEDFLARLRLLNELLGDE